MQSQAEEAPPVLGGRQISQPRKQQGGEGLQAVQLRIGGGSGLAQGDGEGLWSSWPEGRG